jgi:starch synthase
LKILLASSEVHPFSKTGGLADMVGALARALAGEGHDVRVVTPLYRGIGSRFAGKLRRLDWNFHLPMNGHRVHGGLWALQEQPNLTIYFVEQAGYFDRSGIYFEDNISYADNAERYIFFSKCVVHLARYLDWQPEVVHVHDWQTALIPALLLQQKKEGWENPPPSCLTIHNLAYQGVFPESAFDLTNLAVEFFNPEGAEFFGRLNCLKAGIAYADSLTTVSPNYAREIATAEFGCGLEGILQRRKPSLSGILNGVDYSEWNTTRNPHLFAPYSATRLAGKIINKAELQKILKLPVEEKIPLFGTIARLADQKGVEIQLGALAEMLNTRMQFVLLGNGSPEYERAYRDLARRFPDKVAVRFGYDETMAHRIEAGCDFFLMPSKFEPCGLNQMYSLRYGAIPIVRAVGGLDDSVVDWSDNPQTATGIKFYEYSTRSLAKAIRKALVLFSQPKLIAQCQKNGMLADFSWERTIHHYIQTYKNLQTHS